MRFSVIFLLVLTVSVIVTFCSGWGITFGTSYSRLTTISSEFRQLADTFLSGVAPYADLQLQTGIGLAKGILVEGQEYVYASLQNITRGINQTAAALTSYTAGLTQQSLAQMDEVVDTVGTLLQALLVNFSTVATSISAQLQVDMAARVAAAVKTTFAGRGLGLQTLQGLNELTLLNLSRTPIDLVEEADCTTLGVLCNLAAQWGPNETASLALATGRLYSCSIGGGGVISVISPNGSSYTEYHLLWPPPTANGSASPGLGMRQRCVQQAPAPRVQVVGLNCPWPPSCSCGADPRCTALYQSHVNASPHLVAGDVYSGPSAGPALPLSFPLSGPGPAAPLQGVASVAVDLAGIQTLLAQFGLPTTLRVAAFLNDTSLTLMGSNVKTNCSANGTAPGTTALPVWSALRSCDPGLRAVAQALLPNRSALRAPTFLPAAGAAWAVLPGSAPPLSFFVLVGSDYAEVTRAVGASQAYALNVLNVFSSQLRSKVIASVATTQALIGGIIAQIFNTTQALQAGFQAQGLEEEAVFQTTLGGMQEGVQTYIVAWVANETDQVNALMTAHLHAMAVTTGWTVAVIFGVLLLVLAGSGWGTVSIASRLNRIIDLMEAVALMKVEDLRVPQDSNVTEVARIQLALQVLIDRLAEYKGYIPAGLFEASLRRAAPEADQDDSNWLPTALATEDQDVDSSHGSSSDDTKECVSPRGSILDSNVRKYTGPVPVGSFMPRVPRKNIAALAVNVLGSIEALRGLSDAMTRSLFNDYVARVHEAVAQGHGNIDCILGDQIFATFNAHIPCSDPAGAAAGTALDVRSQLRPLGDRLQVQVGVAFGKVFASSVGYTKFKSMVTLGSPMKVAALLSHVSCFGGGAIVADVSLEERVKYSYDLRPLELVYLPRLRDLGESRPASRAVFLLLSKKDLQEDEWLYQLKAGPAFGNWNQAFDALAAATHLQEAQSHLQSYLADHPCDELALRLRDRLPRWVFGAGVPLHEGPE